MIKFGILGASSVAAVQIAGDSSSAEAKTPDTVFGHGAQVVSPADIQKAKDEVKLLVEQHPDKFRVPVRSHMDGIDSTNWRFGGPPDYTLANHSYLTGKLSMHKEGSLEQVVEDLVKTWEMERSHKLDFKTHQTVDQEHFKIGANGGKQFNNAEANEIGNYNVLLPGCDEKLYDTKQSWDASHEAFKGAFNTFPWEVLEVFTGPPVVAFSWRHWGHFTGSYKENTGKGELVEMYGFGTAQVNDKLQLMDVKVFYDSKPFLSALAGTADDTDKGNRNGANNFFNEPAVNRLEGGCPFPNDSKM